MLKRLTRMVLRSPLAGAKEVRDVNLPDEAARPADGARARFFDLAEAMARRERLPVHLAMARLKMERPADYRAAFPARRSGRRVTAAVQSAASQPILFDCAV